MYILSLCLVWCPGWDYLSSFPICTFLASVLFTCISMLMYLQNSLSIVQTGSNIDAPEAGLDALAQIALCDEYVGWRDDAVKLILYFTDDAFKFAGEGRVSNTHIHYMHTQVCNVPSGIYMYNTKTL